MLNRQWSEKQSVTKDHLKTEYHVLIDEAIADGLPDGVPTEEQNDRFLARYANTTGITRKSLGQFKSSHDKIGGRSKKAIKQYTRDMKQEVVNDLADSAEYKDKGYVILSPRRVTAILGGEALGFAVHKMMMEKQTKAIVPLYVESETQAIGFETDTGDWSKERLQDFADDYGEFMGGKEIKLIFMDPR